MQVLVGPGFGSLPTSDGTVMKDLLHLSIFTFVVALIFLALGYFAEAPGLYVGSFLAFWGSAALAIEYLKERFQE